MYRAYLLAGMLLLATTGVAQPTDATRNPDTYPNTTNTYNRPVEVRTGSGNWGWLGLFGLAGLLGRRRRDTVVRDEYTTSDPRRKVA